MIYFDNAATSWPKPPAVVRAMRHYLEVVGATPGRSGHRLSVEAARTVLEAREAVAELLGVRDPLRVAFCANATEAVNAVLLGVLNPGDHALVTGLEHNCVMRPLSELARRGVGFSVLRHGADGSLDPDEVRRHACGKSRLLALVHGSNVTGRVLPVADAVRVAHELGLLALVDVAQTAGCWPIDFERDGMDFLAFTGHKSMMGPPGTGGLVVSERVDVRSIRPLKTGGTGSRSEQFEHPDFMPDRFEAGTPNAVGLAGLAAGVGAVLAAGVEEVRARERQLTDRLLAGLSAIEGVELCGVAPAGERIPVVSFRVLGMSPSEVGARLDEGFGVMARVGLQCSPAAHRTIGTFPAGTVRLSPGWLSAVEEVDAAVEAVACVAAEGSGR